MAERMSEDLLNALRALRVADPDLGLKPLLAKLREQQPDLGAATREVREALIALKAESEAAKAAAAQPAADEGGVPSNDEGSGLGSLALGLQGLQRLADLLGGRSQVWLLLPQLGEHRLETEVGLGHSQVTHGVEERVRH